MPFLDWVNKNQAKETALAVPYHLLNRDSVHGDATAAAKNLLIEGDNLLALKALMPLYAGTVKCIHIDPPYNTRSAFEHYDDRLEHSQWLSMMYPRLVLLRDLLAEDGSIWVTIDDNEAHYLKVLMDEVFGRKNFLANIVWQKKYAVKSDSEFLSESHDHIIVYGKDKAQTKLYRLPRTAAQDARYRNLDNDPRGPWTSGPLQRNEAREYAIYPIISPTTGKSHLPPKGTSWRFTKEKMEELISDNRIYFGSDGNNVPRFKRFLSDVSDSVPATTWWDYSESGHNDEARREAKHIHDDDDVFGTPKPERLVQKILTLASQPGDLVLDSYLGSGTTAAVAHKMGRRYIGIETGAHARTHCLPRLKKVVAGEQGGISEAVGWQGGGGFSFLTLGARAFDEDGRLNPSVDFRTLAAYVWHIETGSPGYQAFDSPLLGIYEGRAYFLLYNGILGDQRPASGNVLTSAILAHMRQLCPSAMPIVVYGEMSRLGPARTTAAGVTFKQIPYDVSER